MILVVFRKKEEEEEEEEKEIEECSKEIKKKIFHNSPVGGTVYMACA